MKTLAEIGVKITTSQREFYRYTGVSAELERRALGVSRAAEAWANRWPVQPGIGTAPCSSGDAPARKP